MAKWWVCCSHSTAAAVGCDRYLKAAQGQTGVLSGGDVHPGKWVSFGKAGGLKGRNMKEMWGTTW